MSLNPSIPQQYLKGVSKPQPSGKSCPRPVLVNEVLLEQAMLLCLHTDHGCFYAKVAESSSCNKGYEIKILSSSIKCLLTSDLACYLLQFFV